MNRDSFSFQEKNILLRKKQKELERLKYIENERKRQLKAEKENVKKIMTKKNIEKNIDSKKVKDIKKQLRNKMKKEKQYIMTVKPRSIFTLDLKNKPPKKYTKEQIVKSLDGYIEIEDVSKIPPNTYLKYITFKNGKQQFMKGGILRYNGESTLTLSNAFGGNKNPIYWPVKKEFLDENGNVIFKTIFFRKALNEEVKMRKEINKYENLIAEQNDMIEQLQRELIKYKKYIKMMKKNG